MWLLDYFESDDSAGWFEKSVLMNVQIFSYYVFSDQTQSAFHCQLKD